MAWVFYKLGKHWLNKDALQNDVMVYEWTKWQFCLKLAKLRYTLTGSTMQIYLIRDFKCHFQPRNCGIIPTCNNLIGQCQVKSQQNCEENDKKKKGKKRFLISIISYNPKTRTV